MSNLESQENELMSLQSIFETKEFSVDSTDPPSGRVVADVRLPDNFKIKYVKKDPQGSENTEQILHIDHLPPISLHFQFPDSYPSDTCPAFLLTCNWLTLYQMTLLCKQLESIWKMTNDAILFTWMQFLQDEVLEFLNISQCLDVTELLNFKLKDNFSHITAKHCPADIEDSKGLSAMCADVVPSIFGGDGTIDARAFNDLSDGKLLTKLLQDYNEYKKEDIFNTTIQDCDVCLLNKPGSDFIKFIRCKHYFCKACVKEYFEELIKDGNVNNLKCLHGKCDNQLDGTTIKGLVKPDLYERYDRLLLSTTLESMSDITYCPRRDCQCPCIIDTCGRMGTCSACNFVFCPFCKMTYHGVAPCNFKSDQKKKLYDEYMNGDSSAKESLEKRFGKRAIRDLVENTLSETWIGDNSKNCPRCQACIEKTEGCNKMTCFKCGSYFCWLCMQVLPVSNPYFHYRDRASGCFNLLFPADYMENQFEDIAIVDIINGLQML